MKFKSKKFIKAAALSVVAAFSFSVAASITYNNRSSIQTRAEIDESAWGIDATNKWLTYTDSSYESIEIEQTYVEVFDLDDGYVNFRFRAKGYNDGTGETLIGESVISLTECVFYQINNDSDNYGYIHGITYFFSDRQELDLYIRKSAEIEGTLPIYVQGWNVDSNNYNALSYYDETNGLYSLDEVVYDHLSAKFTLTYLPKESSYYDPQVIEINSGTYNREQNYVEGLASVNGSQISVRVKVVNGDDVPIQMHEYLYWYYDSGAMHWKYDYETSVSTNDEYAFDIVSAVFNQGENASLNTFEVIFHYDETTLPQIIIQSATFQQIEGGYQISGSWFNDTSSTEVTFTVYGEIQINAYNHPDGWAYDSDDKFFVYYIDGQKVNPDIDRADFTKYLDNRHLLQLTLMIDGGSLYEDFTILNCNYTLSDGFYIISGNWTNAPTQDDGVTLKIAESNVYVTNFGGITYNSSAQRFDFIYDEVIHPGTLVSCTWIDYDSLGSSSSSYLIFQYGFEVDGRTYYQTIKVTNLSDTSRTMSGYEFVGQYEEQVPGGSQTVPVTIECESSIITKVEMKTGFNYIEINHSLVYIDNSNITWNVLIRGAFFVHDDTEDYFSLSYILSNDSGSGDSGSFILRNVTIEGYNEDMQSGILVGNNSEMFGSTTVSLRADSITLEECTVTFLPGDIATGSMEPQIAHIGLSFTAPSCDFVADQYHFVEWEDQDGETYKVGDPIPVTSTSLTLTAKFEHDTYTIIYHPNCQEGEYSGETAPFVANEQGTYQVSDCGYVRPHFNFVGWSTEQGGEQEYAAGSDIELNEAEINLYAVWEEEPVRIEYIITFDSNGGIGSMDPDIVSGTETVLSYNLPTECAFSYPGREFIGWDVNPDSNSPYEPGDQVYVQENTTFYAIWKLDVVLYTISFNANGGEGTMASVEVSQGYNTVPGCDFTREGYDFIGWAVGSPDGQFYRTGEDVYVDADYTLYALWEPKTSPTPSLGYDFRITFKGNGATGGRMSPMNCNKGDNTVPGCDFTRDGYVFVGWAVDSVDSRIIVQPGQTVNVDKDYTLYAIWEKRTVEWRLDGQEIYWYDSAYREDWAEPTSAVYYEGAIAEESLIFVTYSIYRFEAIGDLSDDIEPVVVREVTVVLKGVSTQVEGEYVYISGTFEEVGEVINVSVLAENYTIGETEGRNITPAQEAEIRENIPVDQNEKVDEALEILPDTTATEIISVIGTTNDAIENDDSLTPQEKEAAYESVKKAVEASVVVGAQLSTATEEGEAINDALPENSPIDMSNTLNEFYERQLNILLGKTSSTTRAITRAPSNDENQIDYSVSAEEYGKMISFVDTSVENMTDAALQLRKCSGTEMIAVVETYIQKVMISSFREFDKEAADEEFVAQAYESIMKAMQLQVIEILEKEHQPSNNPEKEAQYNETLEAVKDYETFEQMVIEVLRQKYVSATGNEVDIDTFESMYMDIFRAWALDMPELNPHGITLEELTNATIEVTTNKANHMTFNANFSKGENIFLIVFGSVTALSIAGAIAVPTILKKKREGVSK